MARYSGYDNINKQSVQCTIDGSPYVEMRSVINCYGLGSFSVHIVHNLAGEYNINSRAFDTTNLKNTITQYGQSGFLGFNSNTASELVNNIDALNIHIVNFPAIALPYPTSGNDWTNAEAIGVATPKGYNIGSPMNNEYNNVGTVYSGYMNGEFVEYTFGQEPFSFFNIVSDAIDTGIISVSDDLKKIVDSQIVPIKSDTSFTWDVYINSYRENALKGGYTTESVIVRWSCGAVNKATEEYLQTNPDYEYRADNTIIRLSAKDQKNYDFSTPFFQDLYGTLQVNIPMSKLSNVIGTSDFMKGISEFIPALNAGDCYLYLNYTFQNLGVTDTCVCQIPLNSSTQNVDHLYIRNGRRGSVVRLHYGEPESGVDPSVVGWNDDARDDLVDDSQKFDDDSSNIESDVSYNSNISLLTSTYAMTEENLKLLGKKLWDNRFLENISMINNSPIENILAVKSFPFPISGGASKNVILGNVNMEITGNELPSSFIPRKTIGTFKVDKKFSGVLEWLNYHIEVICYLPYIGFVELNIKEIIDKTITLKYIYDVITGVCTACFYANNIEICKYSGTIAIDIPITASNRAQVESGYIMSALGAVGSLLTGNLMGVAGSAFGALMNQNHFTTKGSPSPSCDAFDEQKAFIIIDYPVYYPPTNYAHDYGYPCNLSMKLGNCKGFTKCANVDVDGLSCTEEERAELKRLLEGGVYL